MVRYSSVVYGLHLTPFLPCIAICLLNEDSQYTGVSFSPYVKGMLEDGSFPAENSYTIQEIEVMLEVISTKFSKVVTFSAGSRNGSYEWNVTYYESDPQVYIAEAAARLNLNKNSTKITVLLTIYISDDVLRTNAEMGLALESAQKANHIFPGTVEGILLSGDDFILNYDAAKRAPELLKLLRNHFVGSLKIGTRLGCEKVPTNRNGKDESNQLWQIYQQILENSEFLICQIDEISRVKTGTPLEVLSSITAFIHQFNETLSINNKIVLMAEVGWASEGEFWNTLETMKEFWEIGTAWAVKNEFLIYFFKAFDEPNAGDSHYGWWKLIDNSKSEQMEGYVEKISEKKKTSDGATTEVILIVVGAIILGISALFIIFLLVRMKKLQQQLSKEDIQNFVEGTTDSVNSRHGNCIDDDAACKHPYDYSYEIVKSQLKINYDKILGTGQFGCVFKATIDVVKNGEPEKIQVALKMAKPGRTRIALKGLLSEIKILIHTKQHPNIVELMGAYTAELHKGIVYIATELCSLGSLQDYLRKQGKSLGYIGGYENITEEASDLAYVNFCEPVSFQRMMGWSLEIATGMEYLGTKNVVHGDLATRNVLLTADITAKISDFGLSRRMYDYTNYIKTGTGPLPWRWMAIESLKRGEFSAKSDVWSYGVTLWEIFTMGDIPYPGLQWKVDFVNMLVDGMRLGPPPKGPTELYHLMAYCWHIQPEERPSFPEIKNRLKALL